jgi:hypothetical protein
MKMTMPRLVLVVLAVCAGGKLAWRPSPRAATRDSALIELPEQLDAVVGERVPLSPVEQRLASAPHVTILRRAYGSTQVSQVTVRGGVREHHPPTVCLRASGYEVVQRQERQAPGGCVVELRVRHTEDRKTQLFTYTYLDGADTKTKTHCSLWRRVGSAVWARLAGSTSTWATVQVLDHDPQRARRVLESLIKRARDRRRI